MMEVDARKHTFVKITNVRTLKWALSFDQAQSCYKDQEIIHTKFLKSNSQEFS